MDRNNMYADDIKPRILALCSVLSASMLPGSDTKVHIGVIEARVRKLANLGRTAKGAPVHTRTGMLLGLFTDTTLSGSGVVVQKINEFKKYLTVQYPKNFVRMLGVDFTPAAKLPAQDKFEAAVRGALDDALHAFCSVHMPHIKQISCSNLDKIYHAMRVFNSSHAGIPYIKGTRKHKPKADKKQDQTKVASTVGNADTTSPMLPGFDNALSLSERIKNLQLDLVNYKHQEQVKAQAVAAIRAAGLPADTVTINVKNQLTSQDRHALNGLVNTAIELGLISCK